MVARRPSARFPASGFLRAATAVLVFALAGCYDLERLEPGPESPYLLVDDFEDNDEWPSVASFGQWRAFPFKPGPGSTSDIRLADPGFEGGRGLVGEFVFTDPGNGDFTGASLGIADARAILDVRRYRAIHVTARFDPGTTPLPTSNTRFYAELSCSSAQPLGGVTGPFFVQRVMPVTSDWQAFRLDRFGEPSPEEPRILGGTSACLAAVDAIRFTISTNLGGGPPAGGSFYLDDVYFE